MVSTNAANKMYDMILGTRNIDESSLKKAKELFEEYKNRGIIRGGIFEDKNLVASFRNLKRIGVVI